MKGEKRPPIKRIGPSVRAVGNLLKRRAESSQVRRDIDELTGAHGYVLGYLAHHSEQEVYQRDLEEAFSVRPSTATVVLQQMEQNGLIVRQTAEHDARCKRIVLTDKAWALHERIQAEHDETERMLREGITDEELAVFFRVMDTVRENLERRQAL